MSDILIRGMEMPENGSCIQIVIDDDGNVYPTVEKCIMKIDSIAKAISVPSHGRLIDADALKAKQQEDADLFKGSTAYGDKCRRDEAMNAVANIVNTPTIIPAEEDE